MVQRPLVGGYDVQVADGPKILADALARIRQAGRRYRLNGATVGRLAEQFARGARLGL